MQRHQQCLLARGTERQTAWIPADIAQLSRTVRLKVDGDWDEKWEVLVAYPGQVASEIVTERSRDYRSHRKATDI